MKMLANAGVIVMDRDGDGAEAASPARNPAAEVPAKTLGSRATEADKTQGIAGTDAAGWIAYQRDLWERGILFWDTLRQRADNMLAHERAGLPPLLDFKSETLLDARRLERLTATFAKAVTDKDFAALGPYYEEEARFLPPGGPMVQGRAAIQSAQRKIVESGVVALNLQAVDIIDAGDFVIEIGRIAVTIRPPGLKSLLLLLMGKRRLTVHGKSVVVWRQQQDGSLKIMVDTFNSDT